MPPTHGHVAERGAIRRETPWNEGPEPPVRSCSLRTRWNMGEAVGHRLPNPNTMVVGVFSTPML